MVARRSYGTARYGSRRTAAAGCRGYGECRVDGRKVRRRIGPKRVEGANTGLTRAQAEREMRRLMAEVKPWTATGDRLPSRTSPPATARTSRCWAASARR
jgi:hypothetical protein